MSSQITNLENSEEPQEQEGAQDAQTAPLPENPPTLSYQYDWFQKNFPSVVQGVFDDFFEQDFTFTLFGICKNVNTLSEAGTSNFVTKIKIDEQHDVFFRMSEVAVELVLENTLGRANRATGLNRLTELETTIITTFNDCLFKAISPFLKPPPPTLKRTNFDVVYLGFIMTDNTTGKSGRFLLTMPDVLLTPEVIPPAQEFPVNVFNKSTIPVNLRIGSTVFCLYDLKHLEPGDMVVFESSDINKMHMTYLDYETNVFLRPNLGLVVPIEDDGGSEVSENDKNIWDSITVEMVAHFDSVNVTLGELKKIQAGMVVDLTSIYQNGVTLTVEDMPIASGELVIVNDKYGVKITQVHAPTVPVENYVAQKQAAQGANAPVDANGGAPADLPDMKGIEAPVSQGDEEEFDYSDFDLEEDI